MINQLLVRLLKKKKKFLMNQIYYNELVQLIPNMFQCGVCQK